MLRNSVLCLAVMQFVLASNQPGPSCKATKCAQRIDAPIKLAHDVVASCGRPEFGLGGIRVRPARLIIRSSSDDRRQLLQKTDSAGSRVHHGMPCDDRVWQHSKAPRRAAGEAGFPCNAFRVWARDSSAERAVRVLLATCKLLDTS